MGSNMNDNINGNNESGNEENETPVHSAESGPDRNFKSEKPDSSVLPEKGEPLKKKKNELISWIKSIALAFIIALLLTTFVFEITTIIGPSMHNTLQQDDKVFVDKISYKLGDPARGDIITCHYPGQNEKFIKRVVALPGETVEVKSGKVIINGQNNVDPMPGEYIEYTMDKIVVPEGSYFVLGDNRNNSQDSHYITSIGTIKKSEILGKAIFRVWPFDKIGALK